MMEKNNETDVFGRKNQRTESKNQTGRTVGAAAAGAAAGMTASAFTVEDPAPQPEPAPAPEPDPTPAPEPEPVPPVEPEPSPDPAPEIIPDPLPEPKVSAEAEPEPIPEPEPVMPVEEIDPQDNEPGNVIEDVTTVEVVYDINGAPMIVATAHNPVDGEFYLVDVDADGDFDVVLNGAGEPVMELTGENDRLITVTDVESKITDDYIARNEIDDMIAQNDMIGEQIQNDITIINDGNA